MSSDLQSDFSTSAHEGNYSATAELHAPTKGRTEVQVSAFKETPDLLTIKISGVLAKSAHQDMINAAVYEVFGHLAEGEPLYTDMSKDTEIILTVPANHLQNALTPFIEAAAGLMDVSLPEASKVVANLCTKSENFEVGNEASLSDDFAHNSGAAPEESRQNQVITPSRLRMSAAL